MDALDRTLSNVSAKIHKGVVSHRLLFLCDGDIRYKRGRYGDGSAACWLQSAAALSPKPYMKGTPTRSLLYVKHSEAFRR